MNETVPLRNGNIEKIDPNNSTIVFSEHQKFFDESKVSIFYKEDVQRNIFLEFSSNIGFQALMVALNELLCSLKCSI